MIRSNGISKVIAPVMLRPFCAIRLSTFRMARSPLKDITIGLQRDVNVIEKKVVILVDKTVEI
jgi:hypothetical protein